MRSILRNLNRGVMVLCMLVALQAYVPQANAAGRGHQWVRSHPFQIMGLVRMHPQPFDIKQYRDAGFSSLLAWEPGTFDEILPIASADGMPYHAHIEHWGEKETNKRNCDEQTLREALSKVDTEKKRAYIRNLIKNPGCIGFIANDEAVNVSYLRYTGQLLKWLRKQHPGALAYGNLHPEDTDFLAGPVFEQYVDEFAAIVNPDVLMIDLYPLGDLETVDGWIHSDGYFYQMAVVRRTALEQGMPYWMFIQSFECHNGWHRRLPSESDLRFQMFAPLTYGYTGIAYFTYDIAFERGLIEETGEPNRLYHAAAKANAEVANVGAALRFLTSTDVRFVPGRHEKRRATVANSVPRGMTAWSRGIGKVFRHKRIAHVEVDSSGKWKDGLLGSFRDDQGEEYFMLTNLWHGKDSSASDCTLDFTIRFQPEVKRVYRLDRITGKTEPVELESGTFRTNDDPFDVSVLRVSLPGGTGDLFKYTAGPFPGCK